MNLPKLHFISGLPRSGTTLLAGLLRQNPRFHAGMSGPIAGLLQELLVLTNYKNQYHRYISAEQKRDIALGVFRAFYGSYGVERVVFDTSRKWSAMLPFLTSLFPAAWVFCCVRNVAWILDSYERVVRDNAPSMPMFIPAEAALNVHSRVDYLASPFGEVGKCLANLSEAFYGAQSSRIVLIQYEGLATEPLQYLRRLYELIDEPWFAHDPMNVEFGADEFDANLGATGLHRLRRVVGPTERHTVLPPALFASLEKRSFWTNSAANTRNVAVW